jgi:DNA-binding transcriptional ArsR family regulator
MWAHSQSHAGRLYPPFQTRRPSWLFHETEKISISLDRLNGGVYFTDEINNRLVKYMPPDHADHLSSTFSALADPTRRAILARLSSGEATVNDLAEPFKISLPAISKHLKVLEQAGLIARGRRAQWRPCRLEAARLRDANAWIELYRKHWEDRFDRLGEYLQELQKKEPKEKSRTRKK